SESFRWDSLEQYYRAGRGAGARIRASLERLDATQTQRVQALLAERLGPHRQRDGIHVVATALLAVAEQERKAARLAAVRYNCVAYAIMITTGRPLALRRGGTRYESPPHRSCGYHRQRSPRCESVLC